MTLRTTAIGAAIAVATATAAIAPAHADVHPASFATGIVQGVDINKGTVTVSGRTYAVRPESLYGLSAGTLVELFFLEPSQLKQPATTPYILFLTLTTPPWLGV